MQHPIGQAHCIFYFAMRMLRRREIMWFTHGGRAGMRKRPSGQNVQDVLIPLVSILMEMIYFLIYYIIVFMAN